MRDTQGSLTIFSAIALSGIILLNLVLLAAAHLHIQETKVSYALLRQLEVTLSLYDRDLWENFGLHGFRGEDSGTEVVDEMLFDVNDYHASLTPLIPLTESEHLYASISAFMKPRLPVSSLQSIHQRMKTISESLESPNLVRKRSAASMASSEGKLEPKPMEPPSQSFGVEDELEASKSLEDFMKEHPDLPFRDQDGDIQESITALTRHLKNLYKDQDQASLYRSIGLREYLLRMLPHATSQKTKIKGCPSEREKNLHGVPVSIDTFPSKYMVESILSNYEGEKAQEAVQLSVMFLRVMFNIAGISSNTERMNFYLAVGEAMSLITSVSSLGTVVIPAEAYQMSLVSGEAWLRSLRDIDRLLVGKDVDLLPYQEEKRPIPTFYEDYLRILLTISSDSDLTHKLSAIITSMNSGSEYYGGACLDISIEERAFPSLTKTYMAHSPEEAE